MSLGQRHIDKTVPQQDQELSNKVPIANSTIVDNCVYALETPAISGSLYHCCAIEIGLCRNEGRVLKDELLSVFKSADLDFERFQRYLTCSKKALVFLQIREILKLASEDFFGKKWDWELLHAW